MRDGITEKERVVLGEFLNRRDYRAYPAKIEKDSRGAVSRVWASKICSRLVDEGILDYKMGKAPRQRNKTEHYFIPNNLGALTRLLDRLLHHADPSTRLDLFGSRYVQSMLDRDLVCEVLSRKGAEVRKMISVHAWSPLEAERLLNIREQRLSPPLRTALVNRPTIALRLLFFDSSVNKEQRLLALRDLQPDSFREYSLMSLHSGIDWVYDTWMEDHVMLPIRCLIKASPSALEHFMFGSWSITPDRDYIGFDYEGTRKFEHVIFRMMIMAIGDIEATRSVPDRSGISSAYFRSEGPVLKSPLLCFHLRDGRSVNYDGGFDTEELYYGEELIPIIRNPENCWMRIWVTGELDPHYLEWEREHFWDYW